MLSLLQNKYYILGFDHHKRIIAKIVPAIIVLFSDCRILDQLMYKWKHSRKVISNVLVEYYLKLYKVGWSLTHDDIVTDVNRFLGGSFEEFMNK